MKVPALRPNHLLLTPPSVLEFTLRPWWNTLIYIVEYDSAPEIRILGKFKMRMLIGKDKLIDDR